MQQLKLSQDEVEAFNTLIWIIVGCAKDISDQTTPADLETFCSQMIMRAMGQDMENARRLSALPLPELPALEIDYSFASDGPTGVGQQ